LGAKEKVKEDRTCKINLSWDGLSQLRKMWRRWAWGAGDVRDKTWNSPGRQSNNRDLWTLSEKKNFRI